MLQALSAVERLVGLPRLDAPPRGREEAVGVREDRQLRARAVDRHPAGARDGRDGADVVDVGVREQDRLGLDAELAHRGLQALGLVAGVDEQRLLGAVGANQVAVLLEGADREHAHVHR